MALRSKIGEAFRQAFGRTLTMWRRGGVSVWTLGKRVAWRSWEDEILGRAAELAYFFLFSTIPLLLFLTTLLGYLAQGSDGLRRTMFRYIAQLSPSPEVTQLLRDTVTEITEGRGGAKLGIGLLVAVWVASNGVLATGRTLNAACSLTENRGFWKRRRVAVGLTLLFALLTVMALALVLYGGNIGDHLGTQMGAYFASIWNVLQWPLVLLFMVLAFEAIYNYAPALGRANRVWLTPGAVIAVGLWVMISLGFRLYLSFFGSFTRAYGSLGVVILLLLWFYFAGFSLLLGGEINSEVGSAARAEVSEAAVETETADEVGMEGVELGIEPEEVHSGPI